MLLCENKQKPKLELCYENMRAPVPEPGSLNQGPGEDRPKQVRLHNYPDTLFGKKNIYFLSA